MTRALVLDPGLVTGAASVRWGDHTGLEVVKTESIPDGCEGFIQWWYSKRYLPFVDLDLVICEEFNIDGTITGTWAPEIQGALKAMWGGTIVWQRRDDKAVIRKGEPERNDWLASRGIHLKTQHERDAVCHGLVHARRIKHMPTLLKYWPKP